MNLFNWLRSVKRNDRPAAAHMTWAHTSVGRSISRTGVFLKKQIWIWPILAVVLLTILGLGVRHAIETTMENGLRSELQTLLDIETAMLETWFHAQRVECRVARQRRRASAFGLSAARRSGSAESADPGRMKSRSQRFRRSSIRLWRRRSRLTTTFAISSPTNRSGLSQPLRANSSESKMFRSTTRFISRALAGETCISTPFPSRVALKMRTGGLAPVCRRCMSAHRSATRVFKSWRRSGCGFDRSWSSRGFCNWAASAIPARRMPSIRMGCSSPTAALTMP